MKSPLTLIAIAVLIATILSIPHVESASETQQLSDDTQTCLSCHEIVTPGIVADWRSSRHSQKHNENASQSPKTVTGCAECHTLNPALHNDTFPHNGFDVHTVVTPNDCALCHLEERQQYSENIMANAYGNLMNNPLYLDLVNQATNMSLFKSQRERDLTYADSCLYCHGTIVKSTGLVPRETEMGPMQFPDLTGWPNQGVGRINPDNSIGACTSCHPRHAFSIKTARTPQACAECHTGPDVPAAKVYKVSKHGNIYQSNSDDWNFKNVPWTVGEDFTAPTCATCHVSEIASPDGEIIARRTHRMNDRLPHRIFGPIFAIPHPKDADTSKIVSPSGLPLPVDLDAKLASNFLISPDEQRIRRDRMKAICLSCHSTGWVDGHFELLENTIITTNGIVLETNNVMINAWNLGIAKGLEHNDSLFNESIERMWVEQWLFYASSVRFASAMGGADYGTFANGRWQMSKNLIDMKELVELKTTLRD